MGNWQWALGNNMKIYMMTDLEGVAGVASFEPDTYGDGKYYEHSKHLLTQEVNAAVDGLLEAGATDVIVGDWHGPGGILFEELHPAARLMHGRPLGTRGALDAAVADCDACIIVGQHAMAGTADGNLNHTQNSRSIEYYKLNGRPIGEMAQFALYQGAMGQPMIFLTGDEAACREAQELVPGITTVAVKKGLGRNSALSLSAFEARRRIREGARRAIEHHKDSPIATLVWPGPFVLEKRFFHSDTADAAMRHPWAERVDSLTVRYRHDDIRQIINV